VAIVDFVHQLRFWRSTGSMKNGAIGGVPGIAFDRVWFVA
jgi:hypothetical protein